MPATPNKRPLPEGQVLKPALAIGGLSVILALGLGAFGVLDRLNPLIASLVSRGGRETFPRQVPDWLLWLATILLAMGLAYAMLASPGRWRRCVLWISAVALVAAWAPVLSLAAHTPAVAGPWIATLWAGFCSYVYASSHRMAGDA